MDVFFVRLAEQIQSHYCLGYQPIPKIHGKTWIDTGEKWLLNVWIALFAKFCRCVSGGTNCNSQFSLIAALNAADALLSKMWSFGLMVRPWFVLSHIFWYASIIWLSVWFLIGSALIQFAASYCSQKFHWHADMRRWMGFCAIGGADSESLLLGVSADPKDSWENLDRHRREMTFERLNCSFC